MLNYINVSSETKQLIIEKSCITACTMMTSPSKIFKVHTEIIRYAEMFRFSTLIMFICFVAVVCRVIDREAFYMLL